MRCSVVLICLFFALSGCKDSKNQGRISSNDSTEEHPGKKLMEIHCYSCHDATRSEADRLGPPMIAIKKHYIDQDTSKEAFINAMQDWIKNPDKKNIRMPGAVKRFGVMPRLPYPEDVIEQIADYMFDNEIEKPEWFDNHYNRMR